MTVRKRSEEVVAVIVAAAAAGFVRGVVRHIVTSAFDRTAAGAPS